MTETKQSETHDRPGTRPAKNDEVCECGRPATVLHETARFGDVPWCGISDGGGRDGNEQVIVLAPTSTASADTPIPGGCGGQCSHLDLAVGQDRSRREGHDLTVALLNTGTLAAAALLLDHTLSRVIDEESQVPIPYELREFVGEHCFDDPVAAHGFARALEGVVDWALSTGARYPSAHRRR